MRYVRARRLSAAAQRLAAGAADILSVAVECGYGSHEAFTRAFRDQFGVTPESVRAQNHVNNIRLIEAIATGDRRFVQLDPPRFENGDVMLVAGIARNYSGVDASAAIPAQWQQLDSYGGEVRGRDGRVTYGVCYNLDDEGSMDYLCGLEVDSFVALPREFARLRLTARRYVVFAHRDHIASIRATWNTIWNEWLPQSGHQAADAPLFERYDEIFDRRTGKGGVELWIPLQ